MPVQETIRAIDLSWIPPTPDITSSSDSQAPSGDALIGLVTHDYVRAALPSIVDFLVHADAATRGFVRNPLHPRRERNRILAHTEPSFDLQLADGGQLRAMSAASGFFEVNLSPRFGDMKLSTIQISLPETGPVTSAKVRAHVHSPDAPVGFYNAGRAAEILAATSQVLRAAVADPDTKQVDRLRAKDLLTRIEAVATFVDELNAALAQRPGLSAALAQATISAYEVREPGGPQDRAFDAAMKTLRAELAGGADGLASELLDHLRGDIDTLQQDHDKWQAWRGSSSVSSFYVTR